MLVASGAREIIRKKLNLGNTMSEIALHPIEAGEKTLANIFSDAFAFEIPPYQRPYAWETEQARDLLEDLIDAMEDQSTSGGVYFLGSIVLIKKPGLPDSKVVDGQQRLTTLTILMSVIRDLTTDIERKIERRAYIFQKASPDKGTTDRFRLLLRDRDRAFFKKNIQEPDATLTLPSLNGLEGSQARIIENAQYFRTYLSNLPEKKRDDLIAFILQRCFLVVVAVPTQESARRIFTVLNARGLDLTATDMLKAELLDRVGNDAEGALASRWEDIEKALGRDGFVDLFTHVRMIHERDKPRSALEKAFATAVPLFNGDPDTFLSTILEPYADALQLLEDHDQLGRVFGPEVKKYVRALAQIDNKDWVAPALLGLKLRADGRDLDVPSFFRDLERVAYFLFLTRANPNDRIQRYADIMDEIMPREGKVSKTAGRELAPAEKAAFLEALNGPIYKTSRVCKPVLLRLDQELSSGGATYENVVSIEHVLPQTVTSGSDWARLFPNLDLRNEWTHKIANLVLLTRRVNSRASNWDFATKKTKYFQSKDGRSPFPLTQTVIEAETWNVDELKSRQSILVGKLATAWRLNEDAK